MAKKISNGKISCDISNFFSRFNILVYLSGWNCLKMTQKEPIEMKINYSELFFGLKNGEIAKSVPKKGIFFIKRNLSVQHQKL